MLCVPAARLLVLHRAALALVLPFARPESATAAQPPIVLPPSVKATVPVGALPLTLAVKATLAPTLDGLSELTRLVVLVALLLLTTCASVALLDPLLAASPP